MTAGRELNGNQLHLRHLLLSPFLLKVLMLLVPRRLSLLSLRRNTDKPMMATGTARNSSKSTTNSLVCGMRAGRELHGIQLHVRHLLLSAFLLKVLLLLLTMFHLQHLLLSPSNESQ